MDQTPTPVSLPRPRAEPAPQVRGQDGHWWSGKGDAGWPDWGDAPLVAPGPFLGYRAYFQVDLPGADARELLEEQVVSWLRSKQYPDDLSTGHHHLPRDARLTVVHQEHQGGRVASRYRLVETTEGTWDVTLTLGTQRTVGAYLWVDVRGPGEPNPRTGQMRCKFAAVPRVVRDAIQVLPAMDSLALLAPSATVVHPDGVASLVEAIQDPDRRGLLLVAGPPESDYEGWKAQVDSLTQDIVGLGATYFLTPSAAEELSGHVTWGQGIAPGSLRTFLPGANLSSTLDSRRHRILGSESIRSGSASRYRVMLGWSAREQLLERPLPPVLGRVDALLAREETEARLTAVAPAVAPREPIQRRAIPDSSKSAVREKVVTTPSTAESPVILVPQGLEELLEELFGESYSDASFARLRAVALEGVLASERVTMLRQELEEVSQDRRELQSRVAELRYDWESEQAEHAMVFQELIDTEARLAYLDQQLHRQGLSQDVIDSQDVSALGPADYAGLRAIIEASDPQPGVDQIVFTGDFDSLEPLADADPLGTWAGKTWRALRALNDYAKLKVDGKFSGGVHQYCSNTPQGCVGWSATNHAPRESDTVANNPAFRLTRMFAVPTSVDPSGKVYMEAHFKIATAGSLSPRLHYWDDTAREGFIYVGYIGPHLPNTRTN